MVRNRTGRVWRNDLPKPPEELVELISDAMIDFGPDGHCDGSDTIAAIVLQWVRGHSAEHIVHNEPLRRVAKAISLVDLFDYHLDDTEVMLLGNAAVGAIGQECGLLRAEIDRLGDSLNKCHEQMMRRTDGPVHGDELVSELLADGRYKVRFR